MKKKYLITTDVVENYNGSCVNCFLDNLDVDCSEICPEGKKILGITKIERLLNKPVFSEGICEDGASILKDGVPMKITEILEILNEKGE